MMNYTKLMMALATQPISYEWAPMIQRPKEPSHCLKIQDVKAEACGFGITRLLLVSQWKT